MPDGFPDGMPADAELVTKLFFRGQQTADGEPLGVYRFGELMRDLHIEGLAIHTTLDHTNSVAILRIPLRRSNLSQVRWRTATDLLTKSVYAELQIF